MVSITSTTLRNNLFSALEALSKKDKYMVVTNKNEFKAALVDIDFFEDLLALTNKKYLKSIKEAREEIKTGKTHTHEEIFGSL